MPSPILCSEFRNLDQTMTSSSPQSRTRRCFNARASPRTPSRRAATLSRLWKVRSEFTSALFELRTHLVAEWTFAKQKWQRTKGVVRGDPKYETAQILPGHNEKLYA